MLVATQDPALPVLMDAGPPAALDEELTAEAAAYLANYGRERTRDTYDERFAAFTTWCRDNQRTAGPPTTAATLTSYAAHLRSRGVFYGTIRLAISAIRHRNARAGYEDHPKQKAALQIYSDARHEQRAAGREQKSSPPVDRQRLLPLILACPDTAEGARNKALFYLGYHCRARRSELARFRVSSIHIISDHLMVVTKATSKNDKTDAGREYDIEEPEAITAVRQWLAFLREQGQDAPHLPLLRRTDKWGNIGPISGKGWGLTPHSVNEIVKKYARRAELDVAETVTAHGLRAGVPTDLGRLGFSAGEIREITGDWQSTDQVEKYRKTGARRAGKSSGDGKRAQALRMLHEQDASSSQPE